MQRARCKTSLINKLSDLEYLLYIISYHSAPTLDGIKPSSLINFKDGKRDLLSIWNKNKELVCKFLRLKYYELNSTSNSTLVLFYDEVLLKETLSDIDNSEFLISLGYDTHDLNLSFAFLSEKMAIDFPHEIGIFLGYPLEDVYEFMYNENRTCLYVGYWKVFSNLKESLKTFEKYRVSQNKIVNYLSDGVNPKTYLSYTI